MRGTQPVRTRTDIRSPNERVTSADGAAYIASEELEDLTKNWDELGKIDPLWAIISDPAKRNNRWNLDEFLATGREEIARVMQELSTIPLKLTRKRALDFGCGIGRLTQALCDYYQNVDGVDIAPSMIEQARRLNIHGERCRYFINARDDLSLFPDSLFDFVYSNIVLQHIPPRLTRKYLREFLRVLRRGGLLMFQLPSNAWQEICPEPAQDQAAAAVLERLPDSAFCASIEVVEAPKEMATGRIYSIQLRITNKSPNVWPGFNKLAGAPPIKAGNHWFDSKGNPLVQDDGRALLLDDLHPNQLTTLELNVTAPAMPGQYFLEIDLVQELVAWFRDKGSPSIRVSINVLGDRPNARKPLVPKITMHGIPLPEIVALLVDGGGIPLDARRNFGAGNEWLSCTYLAIKR
jgi:SAM-dependent methyltransferase